MTRAELETLLIARAGKDPDFRQQLLTHPAAAIKAVAGLELPPEVEVTVFQETPRRLCLVLPARPSEELAESELDAVSGGTEPRMHQTLQRLRDIFGGQTQTP